MRLLVISSAPFIKKEDHYLAYSPYIKEIDIWAKHADEIAFVCPVLKNDNDLLLAPIQFPIAKIFRAKDFNVKSVGSIVWAFLVSFLNFFQLFRGMIWADHIHLRCPGNLGLMACAVQIFFPKKIKTAKYAGNWDPNSKQPLAYRMQRWMLSNTFLTKNMQVLVYGEWTGSTKNIKPFFTASYRESDKIDVLPRLLNNQIDFVFVGTLSEGKRPLYAVKIIHELVKMGVQVRLSLYGTGPQKSPIEDYIIAHQLEQVVFLMGNFSQEAMKNVYQKAHFNILPSESEGWPKVIAESMFWGCLPIVTAVSCVPNMLDNGKRGLLLSMNLNQDVEWISKLIHDQIGYQEKVLYGMEWSRKFTLDLFESEIENLLKT